MYSKPLYGSEHVVLICANGCGYRGLWHAVSKSDSCARFRQAVDLNRSHDFARDDMEGARLVPLTQGKFALVDEADYATVMKHRWYAAKNYVSPFSKSGRSNPLPPSGDSPLGGGEPDYTFYALRHEKGRTVRMHRQITGATAGEVVDHINHDGLDNRRCNLRVCSHAENMRNQRGQRGGSSRYKGVSRDLRSGKWRAQIWHDGETTYLGRFESEAAAARAYNAKARELYGDFAYLNPV